MNLPQSSPARIYQADSRAMLELADDSVDLVVTSPLYWQIKDDGASGQIGWRQTLPAYLFGVQVDALMGVDDEG